jgi:hypothetical protein
MIGLVLNNLYFRYVGSEKLADDDLNKSFARLSRAATIITTTTAAGQEEEEAVSISELKLDVAKALRVLIAKLNPNNPQDNENTELINDRQDKLDP